MRTLVVSDLHIGAGNGRARLENPDTLAVLAAAAAQADRLVLLGDVLELRHGPVRDALAAASRVLPGLVAGMRAGSEVVLAAGNHDHELLAAWMTRRAAGGPPVPMTLETPVDWVAGEPMAAVADCLGRRGVAVRAAYPGVWLRDDVYATHGHYLDCHTTAPGFERLGAGAMSRMLGLPAARLRTVDDYERVLAPIYAWMLAISERRGPALDGDGGGSSGVLEILHRGGMKANAVQLGVSGLAAVLQRLVGLGELSGDVSGQGLFRGEMRGISHALSNLGVQARYVIFGHTHRAGPVPAADQEAWRTPAGVALFNTGCWVQENHVFVDTPNAAESPYRAGFVIELDDDGPPRLVNLLDR